MFLTDQIISKNKTAKKEIDNTLGEVFNIADKSWIDILIL